MPVLNKDQDKKLNPAEKRYSKGSHEDLGLHPERRKEEINDLEKLYNAESAPGANEGTKGDKTEKEALRISSGAGWKTNIKSSGSNPAKLKKLRKRLIVGGAFSGFLFAIVFALFSFLSPFRLTHIVESIEQRVGQVPQNAVENRLEWYATRYLMIQAVGGSDVDIKNRGFTYIDNSWFKTLYTNWKGAKLEVNLLEKYGYKLEPIQGASGINRRLSNPNQWRLVNVGVGRDSPLSGQTLDKPQVRQFIREFARSETRSWQIIKRHNMRKILKLYNGVDRWKPFEKTIDEVEDKYNQKKLALKRQVIQRTVGNLSPRYGTYLTCLLETDRTECRKQLRGETPGSDSPDLPRSEIDDALSEAVDGDSPDTNNAITRRVSEKLSNLSIKKGLTKWIPVVGWVNFASLVVQQVESGAINEILYARNAQQYASFASVYISANDQLRSGEGFDPEDLRAANEIFDNFDQSPVYQTGSDLNTGVLFGSAKVSAQGQLARDCNNDGDEDDAEDLLEPGETVCPEKRLIQDKTSFVNDSGVWDALVSASNVEQSTLGSVFNFVEGVISSALDTLRITDAIAAITDALGLTELASRGFQIIIDRAFSPPLTGNEEGEDAYDALYGGIATMNSQFGGGVGESRQDTIGGKALTSTEVANIKQETQSMYAYRESQQSTLERYFSPLNSKSLTSFALVKAPTLTEASSSLFTNISPSNIFRSVSSLFGGRARAQDSSINLSFDNPHKNIYYGYNQSHPIFSANNGDGMNPDEVEQTYSCSLPAEERPQNQVLGKTNEIPFDVPLEEDPCALDEEVSKIGSLIFTGEYDAGIDEGSRASEPSTDVQANAAKGEDTSLQQCKYGTDGGVQNTPIEGIRIRICVLEGIDYNVAIEENVKTIIDGARAAGIDFSGSGGFRSYDEQVDLRKSHCGTSQYDIFEKPSRSCSPPTARPGSSMHEWGLAVDLRVNGSVLSSGSAGFNWMKDNQSIHGLINLPSEPWHWSTTGN